VSSRMRGGTGRVRGGGVRETGVVQQGGTASEEKETSVKDVVLTESETDMEEDEESLKKK